MEIPTTPPPLQLSHPSRLSYNYPLPDWKTTTQKFLLEIDRTRFAHTYIYIFINIYYYCSRSSIYSEISFCRHFVVIAVCTRLHIYIYVHIAYYLYIYTDLTKCHTTLSFYRPPRPGTTTDAVVVFWRFITVVPKNRGLIFTSKRR